MAETAWYRAPSDLFSGKRALKFFPTASMDVHAQLNSIVRFFVYYSIIMVILTRNPRHLLVAVLGAILTAIVSEFAYKPKGEKFDSSSPTDADGCVRPTVDNPHMNYRVFDPRDRSQACKPWQVKQQTAIAEGTPLQDSPFQKSFDRFYTMPCTTAVNDQRGFADWLYGSMPTKSRTCEDT